MDDRQRHERLQELLLRARSLSADEQAAYLNEACGDNAELREQIDRLLAHDKKPVPFVDAPFRDGAGRHALREEVEALADPLDGASKFESPGPGTRIDAYKLLEKIGEGGMGEVYAADQLEPVQRRVALKLIKAGMDSAQVVARFEAERQALARMSHPNVAQVFDGGTTPAGHPYFVMEYVAGEPITDHCDRRKLSTRERVRIFLDVCEGVQHAHQKGVVHRDLKPSNLLVTRQGDRAVPKIIDFGIARATTGRLSERTLHTLQGQIIGTLDYMSPEQADPSGVDIDTRSDIYSLGVVLYQLVSGLLPFDLTRAGGFRLSEVQRAICESDAPSPSSRLKRETDTATKIATLHGTDGGSLVRQLRGDLDWICLKALEKDPARRYASASELADDLRRFLEYLPTLAGRPGLLYRAGKMVRRNRVRAVAAALVLLASLVGVGGVLAGRFEAQRSEQFARAAIDAERVLAFEVQAEALWPPHPAQLDELRDWVRRAEEVVEHLPLYRRLREELRERGHAPDMLASGGWRFDAPDDERKHGALVRAIEAGERLSSTLLAENSVTPGRGWSVKKRLAFAEKLEANGAAGGEPERIYRSLDLKPQLGLLPLGPDPASGLWEFAHLMSGEPARRDSEGRLILEEETGIVLVLIPGGTFWMGNQSESASLPNFDPAARPGSQVHEVRLSPYFLSKYEMTQAQWLRLTGTNPSAYGPDEGGLADWLPPGDTKPLLHPVEQVSWDECAKWLPRFGLTLPSEAQWEHATRAGTQTRFFTGSDPSSLAGAANLRDTTFERTQIESWNDRETEFDDGCAFHWAIGSHRANPFGLHDVHGNVWEWCLDGYAEDPNESVDGEPPVDPVVMSSSDLRYVYRGGSFRHRHWAAGSASRAFDPPSFSGSARGVRPARLVER